MGVGEEDDEVWEGGSLSGGGCVGIGGAVDISLCALRTADRGVLDESRRE